MLTHQVTQDTLQEFNFNKTEVLPTPVKETTKLRRTKLKMSQHSQLAMERMELRVSIALLESHYQSVLVILSQKYKRE
jgi:hypothetical protein